MNNDSKNNEEKNVERPYIVDGIKEYDNPLPPWWVTLFWGCNIFAVIYLIYIHGMGGPTLDKELETARSEHQKQMTQMADAGDGSGSDLKAVLSSKEAIEAGKAHYKVNCVPCHGPEGQGLVGPNLTDKYWLHGGSAESIIKSISEGIPTKGMVPWKAILGPKKIKETAAFIMSLKGTNPPNPKAPEGEPHEGS